MTHDQPSIVDKLNVADHFPYARVGILGEVRDLMPLTLVHIIPEGIKAWLAAQDVVKRVLEVPLSDGPNGLHGHGRIHVVVDSAYADTNEFVFFFRIAETVTISA